MDSSTAFLYKGNSLSLLFEYVPEREGQTCNVVASIMVVCHVVRSRQCIIQSCVCAGIRIPDGTCECRTAILVYSLADALQYVAFRKDI